MKKTTALLVLIIALTLSACSKPSDQNSPKNDNPLESAGNYAPGMVEINKKAQQDIKDATNKENEKINNTLNENNMNSNQNTPGDNSELVKKYAAALIKTSLGDIKVKFYGSDAPITVGNFFEIGTVRIL